MLITFSGVDCAGKSTQISLLEGALGEGGLGTRVFWHRPGYSAELNALKALVRRVAPRALPGPGNPAARERAFGSAGVSTTWIRLAALDMAFQYGVKLRTLSATGVAVIADRYLDDSLLDLEVRFPGREVARWPTVRMASAMAPRPTHAFLLMLPHEVMLQRMERKQEPFPDPPHIRDARFDAYRRLADSGRYRVIDANRSIEDVHAEIRGCVLSR